MTRQQQSEIKTKRLTYSERRYLSQATIAKILGVSQTMVCNAFQAGPSQNIAKITAEMLRIDWLEVMDLSGLQFESRLKGAIIRDDMIQEMRVRRRRRRRAVRRMKRVDNNRKIEREREYRDE